MGRKPSSSTLLARGSHIISKISIHPNYRDRLIWKLEKNGRFTVKSAYKKLYEDKYNFAFTNPAMRNIWIKLWRLPAFPRVQHFLWKCLSNTLATREKLSMRISDIEANCLVGYSTIETVTHIILHCDFARAAWLALAGCNSAVPSDLNNWIMDWFKEGIEENITEKEIAKRATIAWSLWTEECEVVFQQKTVNIHGFIARTRATLSSLTQSAANTITTSLQNSDIGISRQNLTWTPPATDFLTCNCDDLFML